MPSPPLPILELHPSRPAVSGFPGVPFIERTISRATLLDIAPDREVLLIGTKSVEEIRETLQIHVGSTDRYVGLHYSELLPYIHSFSHWLYRTQRHLNFKRRDFAGTKSISEFMAGIECHDPKHAPDSAPSPPADCIVSPRPLGPTHILAIYSIVPSPKLQSMLPETIELPINDLLFVLNIPNLSNPKIIPHRLPCELPRVFMNVKRLETFPELVVYLHTRNQAELFRRILPEWIRDAMYPLPLDRRHRGGNPPQQAAAAVTTKFVKYRKFTLGWILRSLMRKRQQKKPAGAVAPPAPFYDVGYDDGSIYRIAKNVFKAEASSFPSTSLLNAIVALDALKDNLEFIGFFGVQVWTELELSRKILIMALNLKARLDEE